MQGLLLLVSLLLGLIFLILTVFAPSPLMVLTLSAIFPLPVLLLIIILFPMSHSMTWMTMMIPSLNHPLTLYMHLFFLLLLLWLILLPAIFML